MWNNNRDLLIVFLDEGYNLRKTINHFLRLAGALWSMIPPLADGHDYDPLGLCYVLFVHLPMEGLQSHST
jgi:hypothetical protein